MRINYSGTVVSVTKREKSTYAVFISENSERIEFFSNSYELIPFESAEISLVKGYRHMFLSDYIVSKPSPLRSAPSMYLSAAYFSELMKYIDTYGEKENELIGLMNLFISKNSFLYSSFKNIEELWLKCQGVYDSRLDDTCSQVCQYLNKISIPLRDAVLKQFKSNL